MTQAINCARPGGSIGYVGVPHGVTFDGQAMFFAQRRIDDKIRPGKVFDLTLPLSEVAQKYREMDRRRAIKTMLTV